MKIFKQYRSYAVAMLFLLVLGGIAGYAQNYTNGTFELRPELKVVLSGVVERGDNQTNLTEAGKVGSGEVINWTMNTSNSGNAPAKSHEVVGQIPNGTTFVSDSATSENKAIVSFSVDNGKTFSAQPTISEKQPDGSVKEVPAPVSMYNQIKFHWDTPLAVSAQRNATYKVRVK